MSNSFESKKSPFRGSNNLGFGRGNFRQAMKLALDGIGTLSPVAESFHG